jgi:hypothetical protein
VRAESLGNGVHGAEQRHAGKAKEEAADLHRWSGASRPPALALPDGAAIVTRDCLMTPRYHWY